MNTRLVVLFPRCLPFPSHTCYTRDNVDQCSPQNPGMIHKTRPIFSTQFHPEAKGGPLDSSYLFDAYLDSVQKFKKNQAIFQPKRDSRPSPMLVDILAKERVGVVPTAGMESMARLAAERDAPVAATAA